MKTPLLIEAEVDGDKCGKCNLHHTDRHDSDQYVCAKFGKLKLCNPELIGSNTPPTETYRHADCLAAEQRAKGLKRSDPTIAEAVELARGLLKNCKNCLWRLNSYEDCHECSQVGIKLAAALLLAAGEEDNQ